MLEFDFFNPVRLSFGAGRFDGLGEQAAEHGSHALLVTGRSSARKSGLLDRASKLMQDNGMKVTVFDRVEPNPTDASVDEGGELARAEGCDVVVAVGGGSTMDAAKGIAVAATHDGPVAEYLKPKDRLEPTDATLPLVCATTTSGTSSELTPFAVITVQAAKQKSAIRSDYAYPKVAIVDPELTLTCPPYVTGSTGIDVLCHSVEGYLSTSATPLTDHCAEKAMELVGEALPGAYADGSSLQHRYDLSLANVFAGYVLSNAGVTVLHALEHPISAHYPDVAHGAGLAVLMVGYAERLWEREPCKFARLAELLGRNVASLTEAEAAQQAAGAIKDLLAIVGLDIGLGELGVERDKLPTIADDTLEYMFGALGKTPGGLDRDELIELLEASF